MTKKDELIQQIESLEDGQTMRTLESLVSGETNRMTFACSKARLKAIITERFNNDLVGSVPGGVETTILSWEVIDKQ